MWPTVKWFAKLHSGARKQWREPQHRNAVYLMLNTGLGAVVGVGFWILLVRLVGLPASEIGVGYAIISLGTAIGVLAKGGLDTALLRTVPGGDHRARQSLLRFAMLLGGTLAILVTLAVATLTSASRLTPDATAAGWALVALIAALLVVTWLQDAYFLADGDAAHSFHRNVAFSAARLLLPLPLVMAGAGRPVALAWAGALALSAMVAAVLTRRLRVQDGRPVTHREFLHSALRNISGSAAEFLPGLLLVPLVLALHGPAPAAYFGIAWTAASLLFLASMAIGRSALAEMVRNGHDGLPVAIRRAVSQHVWLVLPAAAAAAVLAPYLLAIFGADYAREGALVLTVLSLSILVVAPSYLYLGVLRARERTVALVLFPLAMIAVLGFLVPILSARYGTLGVALAWTVANVPFGLYSALKLRILTQGVTPPEPATALHRAPHLQ